MNGEEGDDGDDDDGDGDGRAEQHFIQVSEALNCVQHEKRK
jgi:hypothetical protein